jgi:hypothetical protein
MRKIERISISAADRERLERFVRDRNTPQKVVWQAPKSRLRGQFDNPFMSLNRAGLGEGQIAEFVEDDEVHARQVIRHAALTAGSSLSLELVDQVDDIEEAAADTPSRMQALADRSHHHLLCISMRNVGEKFPQPLRFRLPEDLRRRTAFEDYAAVHEDNARRDLAGEAHFMGDDQHGCAGLGEAADGEEHLLDEFGIKCGRDLVKEEEARVHGERPCNGYTLLLAAGKR